MRTVLTVRLLQAIAVVASLALIMWTLGIPTSLPFVEAANLTNVSNTLSDSDLNALSNHEIAFTVPATSAGLAGGQNFTITFPAGFTGTSTLTLADFDLEIDTVDATLTTGAPGANEWQLSTSSNSNVFTFTAGASESLTAGTSTVVKIGTNADGGANQVTNPGVAASYEFNINLNAGQDTATTEVVILDNVDVTASVDTQFTFSIAGVIGGQSVNGTTTTGSSTATTIPFGQLVAGSGTTTAQDLTVVTNASQGYSVTVVADQDLMSSTGAIIDCFAEGVCSDTPTTWSPPSGTVGSPKTYGHWGITSEDGTTTRAALDEFDTDEWASVSSTTPIVVMGHDGPVDGANSGSGFGTARVGYKVQITNLQEAGDDYSTTLTYVATPIF